MTIEEPITAGLKKKKKLFRWPGMGTACPQGVYEAPNNFVIGTGSKPRRKI
jgi:hypothetical protein